MKKLLFITASLLMLTACNDKNQVNPLLVDSTLPYGAPEFDKIKVEHFKPAVLQAIEEAKAEVDAIIRNPEAPTFENTIEALEFCGIRYNNIEYIFGNLHSTENSDEMQAIAEELSPIETEFAMYISLNDTLFQRVKAVYDQRESLDLAADSRRLLENTYKSFVRSGANLSDSDKELYSKYQNDLSLLQLQFGQNALNSTNAFSMLLTEESELEGLPDFVREQGAAAAAEKGQEGWLFNLSQPSYVAFMKYSTRRDLKEKLYRAYCTRGMTPGNDNSDVIKQIVDTRIKVANLLGYETFADYKLDDRMAGSVANVNQFMKELTDPSLPVARKEVAEVAEFAHANGFEGELMAWDMSYWIERLRIAKYDLSDEELKPYFKLENCIPAVFGLASRLYGLQFEERFDLPVYNPEVKVYDVKSAEGEHLSLLYADFFPRESKRAGAWMSEFRPQRIINGVEERPIITINMNFTKPTGDKPALITHDELITFMHEFGHAIQGMTTQGRYPSMTGTSVDHDFVELFSQINENWGYEAEFLNGFARHYETGKSIPQALIDRIKAAKNFMSAYYQIRQLQYGTIDMKYHTLTEDLTDDVVTFEKNAIAPLSTVPYVDGTCSATSFTHIFNGGYSAGYYSYKWSEVLAADAFSKFEEDGIFNQQTAAAFMKMMSAGDSVDPSELYREFRGHDPKPEALLVQLGIISK